MKYILLLLSLASVNITMAQSASEDTAKIYQFAEQMPHAEYDMAEYLGNHLEYPDSAGQNNIQGRVIVSFVVNKDGSIAYSKVVRGIGYGCNEAAQKVIANMPAWKPGMEAGQPVRVSFSQAVTFKIDTATPVVWNLDSIVHADSAIIKSLDEKPAPQINLFKFISENLRYPKSAREHNMQAKVYVRIRINEDGIMDSVLFLSGRAFGFDTEVRRVLNLMKPWKPGKKDDKPVAVFFTMPFSFKLD